MKKEVTENKLDNEIEDEIRKEKKSIKFTLTQVVMMVVVGTMLGVVGGMALMQNRINELNNEKIEKERILQEQQMNDIFYKARQEDCVDIVDDISGGVKAAKPVLYIYPEEKEEVTVKLGNPELLTVTYPKYESEGWKVIAEPDGTLEDVKTGRELYCLYWEGLNSKEYEGELKEGFVVQGEETAKFLEEKLEILGLNEKETQEFIIYWLPKLEVNNYNYIRFRTKEEIETNMPLEINPNPDTIIRVMMEWKGLENPVEVEEQSLEKAERKGYTVVEWGGTELK